MPVWKNRIKYTIFKNTLFSRVIPQIRTHRTAALSLLPPEIINNTLTGIETHATIIKSPTRTQITQTHFRQTRIFRSRQSRCITL